MKYTELAQTKIKFAKPPEKQKQLVEKKKKAKIKVLKLEKQRRDQAAQSGCNFFQRRKKNQ